MRREVRRLAVTLVLLFSVSRAVAASSVATARPGPISDALCGRGVDFRARLAKALDEFDPRAVPHAWREVKIENFQRWYEAPICVGASEKEKELYQSRYKTLDHLGRRLERAKETEQIGAALARFRGWRPGPEKWPRSSECYGCAALRVSAIRVADIASRWPPRSSTMLGARLTEAAKRESLIADLCKAKPSRDARAEIEKRFRYYSWTVAGAKLFEVAALFEQPEVVAGCGD